jgi:nucleoid DNA-binding protein
MKMNERLSTRSLADTLAIQTGLDKDRAEKFIDLLSSYITQGIEGNQAIRVMGLGTFKVVLVRERESVHIQTGEHFVIPAHHKLSFIPDKDFKDQINRPFAFLEPVEATEDLLSLKKQTFQDQMQAEVDPEFDDERTEEPEIPVVMLDDDITEDLSEETGAVQYTPEEMADDVDVLYEEVGLPQKEDEDDPLQDKDSQTQPGKAEKKTVPLWLLWFLLLPFLIITGISIGTYAFLHYNSEKSYEKTSFPSGNNQADTGLTTPLPIGESRVPGTDEPATGNAAEDDAQLIQASVENTDSVLMENTSGGEVIAGLKETESVKKEEKPVIDWLAPSPERAKPEPKRADKPNAAIEEKHKSTPATSGSRSGGQTRNNTTASTASRSGSASSEKVLPARVRMTAGSSLTQIAMEHYGDKVFWVYIYDYNKSHIKDFNNIPVGTEIRLPQPKIYGINAKSKTSIQKARQKQSELLKWDKWDDYQ